MFLYILYTFIYVFIHIETVRSKNPNTLKMFLKSEEKTQIKKKTLKFNKTF